MDFPVPHVLCDEDDADCNECFNRPTASNGLRHEAERENLTEHRSSSSQAVHSGHDLTVTQRILSSGIGSMCTALLMTPLDVVKIRLHNQQHPAVKGECFLYSNGLMDHLCQQCDNPKAKEPCEWYNRPGNFRGTLDAFIKIPRQEGIRSLWAGLLPTLVMAVPSTVFYFSAYDLLHARTKHALAGYDIAKAGSVTHELVPPMVAGMAARSASVTLVAPLEVVRTKMQSEHMELTQIGQAVRASLQVHGWRGLYLGWIPTLMRDVPFSAIYWAGYELTIKQLMRRNQKQERDFFVAFASGAISGTIASILTNPFDVAKTRRQMALGKYKTVAEQKAADGTLRIIWRSLRERGILSLWAGIVPRIVKVAPACAIMIGSYEFFKQHFAKKNQRTHQN